MSGKPVYTNINQKHVEGFDMAPHYPTKKSLPEKILAGLFLYLYQPGLILLMNYLYLYAARFREATYLPGGLSPTLTDTSSNPRFRSLDSSPYNSD